MYGIDMGLLEKVAIVYVVGSLDVNCNAHQSAIRDAILSRYVVTLGIRYPGLLTVIWLVRDTGR